MSSSPPPGWYRDPSYPLTERWWDGNAWTDHRRQPDVSEQPSAQPQAVAAKGPGRTKVVALAAAGAVLVASAVTGAVVLLGKDDEAQRRTSTAPTAKSSEPDDESTSEPASPSPSGTPTTAVDDLNGISFPILDGWTTAEDALEDDAVLITPDTYHCPGEGSVCRDGRVVSRTITGSDETSPKVLAEADIEDAANAAYGPGKWDDQRPYGDITGHKVVGSGAVAVAGRAGYFVRWRVTTDEGPGGYVQSLVFPSSSGSGAPVLVRFALDARDEAPPVDDIDEIVKGIRPVDDGGTDGGVGSSIGPS
ncbi:hypothetical protein SGFS_091740 [Streptomyces graminofaciens]|uniref:DUF2510 domain-containing protein n=1 Tax=Streptomyces graminofaciens TaxID=68212 RepID=A0ABN5VZ41_9ACTN|nr:DUF2510 domain-containing protein [Streptomyces graminofaciens]BBC37880.1 hypothetical protein SGFS_091740 [Streptomyces graminofaciens]